MENDNKLLVKYLKDRMSFLISELGRIDSLGELNHSEEKRNVKIQINEVVEAITHFGLIKEVYG